MGPKSLRTLRKDTRGAAEVFTELLLMVIIVTVAAEISLALKPPAVEEPYAKILVRDAKGDLTTNQAFDVVMVSGSVRYSDMRVILRNATDGSLIDIAKYNGGMIAGNVIQATVDDVDAYFTSGDMLRFVHNGTLLPGEYIISIADKEYVLLDTFVDLE